MAYTLLAFEEPGHMLSFSGLQEAGSGTVDTLVSRIYDDVDPRLHPIAKSSLLAHLLKLEADGRVRRDRQDAQAVWQVVSSP